MKCKPPSKSRAREIVVIGVDSETHAGPPISIQFYSYDRPQATAIIQVNGDNSAEAFFKHLERACKSNHHYRLYGHYLEFDLVSFFWPMRRKLVGEDGLFDFTYRGWRIVGCYGRPTFARLVNEHGVVFELVDSALWFRGSLDAAAAQYCPDLRKLERPAHLGEQWFSVKDSAFAAYAMRDAEIAVRLGALVEQFHARMSLAPSMTLASQAAQIFRAHYITEPIVQCPAKYIEPAICAYHGGKNNLVRGAAPAWHVDNAMYDLSSAYPWAMTELPSFTEYDAYREASLPAKTPAVPVPGVYQVTGRLSDCRWPIFFTHDFKPLRNCRIEDLWVHGHELNEALRTGEFAPTARIKGCFYEPDGEDSATARFARDFYRAKSEAGNPIDRYMYKILLNCLSGKFIQTRKQVNLDDQGNVVYEHVAGGLFQPFIAGAITAHTRAVMHRVEHEFGAHHTATDGIIAPYKLDLKHASERVGVPTSGLGSLNEEMRGNIILLRTKLYIGYLKGASTGKPSRVFSDWSIGKYALHGFQGSVGELEEMVMSGRRFYIAPHRIGLREAIKHGTTPNFFAQRQMNLQVGPVRN